MFKPLVLLCAFSIVSCQRFRNRRPYGHADNNVGFPSSESYNRGVGYGREDFGSGEGYNRGEDNNRGEGYNRDEGYNRGYGHNRGNGYNRGNEYNRGNGHNRGEDSDGEEGNNGGGTHSGDQGNWERKFPTCGGQNQSPVDLNNAVSGGRESEGEIKMYTNTEDATLENTGHSVQVSLRGQGSIKLEGLSLPSGEFLFKQLHLHWGEDDEEGSEHTIAGRRYSSELHLVFYNSRYGSFENAAQKSDGLAVVGVLLQVSREDNEGLTPIIRALGKIRKAKSKTGMRIDISKLMPTDRKSFYRYSGSLTTPPCSESVTWFVLQEVVSIGRNQLRALRKVHDEEGKPMAYNWRHLQNLGRRSIRVNSGRRKVEGNPYSNDKDNDVDYGYNYNYYYNNYN